jgi:hypothetical protein
MLIKFSIYLDVLDVISDFHREVDEICALLGHYAVYSDNSLPTFRENLSVPYPRAMTGPVGCTETSVRN